MIVNDPKDGDIIIREGIATPQFFAFIDEIKAAINEGGTLEVNDLTSSVTWTNVPDVNITQSSVTQHEAALTITESQISDLQSYLLTEINDLTASVTWSNVPDANITESSVTQHQSAFDHGSISGLSDDDHPGNPWSVGRVGGQTITGSPTSGEDLTLEGSSGANPGFINADSPIIFGPYTANPSAAYGFSYTAVDNPPGVFVGGGLNMSGTISMGNSVFIYESYRGAPHITTNATPGFAAYTVLQALPRFTAGTVAGRTPLAPLIINAGATLESAFVGTMTTGNSFGINFAPQTRAIGPFVEMAVTNQTAVNCQPTVSTNNIFATAAVGNVRGLHQKNPITALFQPNTGINTMVFDIAVDVDNITFGGNVTKAAVRSAQNAASNAYVIQGTGTAQSELRGQLFFPVDLVGNTFGAGSDTNQGWAGAGFFFQSFAVGQQWRLSAGTNFNRIDNDNNSELQIGFSECTIEGDLVHQGSLAGLYNATPVSQDTDIAAMTLTTHSGVPNTILADVSGSGDDATINDNLHELGLQINNLRDHVRRLGSMA